MKTILITGASSGFGLETARTFLDRGWAVIATMRDPRDDLLPASEHLRILPLDVTDATSIARAVERAGPVDALVNNAGGGLMGALEGTSMAATRDLFELNTFGTMAVTQAMLPGFRKRRTGVIVNVTSAVTLKPLPLLSAYTASKAAVEAFSANLALEVEPFGIRVHWVLPGRAPETSFGATARGRSKTGIPEAYADWAKQIFSATPQGSDVTTARDVARAVWQAVTDPSSPERIPAGADAVALAGSPTSTAAHLLKRSLDTFLAKDIKGWSELCDRNVVVEFPFAPDEASRKIVGRAAIYEYLKNYPSVIDVQSTPTMKIRATDDPNMAIAEWSVSGRVISNGNPYEMSYATFATFRNGLIVNYREYWNPMAFMAAMSGASF
jgi:NAD(P)-dependent dehydrogenase (short-subunit alcohol dehydrogenase family)/ketosteroid isomerase-like protein